MAILAPAPEERTNRQSIHSRRRTESEDQIHQPALEVRRNRRAALFCRGVRGVVRFDKSAINEMRCATRRNVSRTHYGRF